jgi:uncharacterized RDD family membrane protein YckC
MSATVPMVATSTPPSETQGMVYATFWRRVSADIFDSVGFYIAIFIPSSIVGRAVAGFNGPLIAGVMPFVLWLAYNALGDGRGATLGKHWLKLRVIDAAGQAPGIRRGLMRTLLLLGGYLLYELATVLSASGEPWASIWESAGARLMLALLLVLDDLWMLWDPHSQTLHDKLAGTYVVAARSTE